MGFQRDRDIRIAIDVRCLSVSFDTTLLIQPRGEVLSRTAWVIQVAERWKMI